LCCSVLRRTAGRTWPSKVSAPSTGPGVGREKVPFSPTPRVAGSLPTAADTSGIRFVRFRLAWDTTPLEVCGTDELGSFFPGLMAGRRVGRGKGGGEDPGDRDGVIVGMSSPWPRMIVGLASAVLLPPLAASASDGRPRSRSFELTYRAT